MPHGDEIYTAPFPCKREGCDGTMRYIRDEYGGLSGGGDYAVMRCDKCGGITYVQLPD